MLRHGGTWALDLSGAGLSQSGFFGLFNFFLRGMWLSFPPLVAAVLITPKGAESPGSGCMEGQVRWFFFPSEAVLLHSPWPAQYRTKTLRRNRIL